MRMNPLVDSPCAPNQSASGMSAVCGVENKAIKLLSWHLISHNKRKYEKRSYKDVFTLGAHQLHQLEKLLMQPPPAVLCVRDLFYALFITTNRPPEQQCAFLYKVKCLGSKGLKFKFGHNYQKVTQEFGNSLFILIPACYVQENALNSFQVTLH